MLLLLVRHGQSLGNVEQRIQGIDDPLTDHGREQARGVARALADRGDITHLYASPLDRALETASIIGAATGREPAPRGGRCCRPTNRGSNFWGRVLSGLQSGERPRAGGERIHRDLQPLEHAHEQVAERGRVLRIERQVAAVLEAAA